MALNIRYEGIGHLDLTYTQKSALLEGTDEGKLVAQDPSNNDTVIIPAAEVNFEGVALTIDKDGGVTVAFRGIHKVSYTGTAPARGNKVELIGNGSGGVKVPATGGTGKFYTVKHVDTVNFKIWFILG